MEAKELLWRDYTVDECMSCARGMPHDDDVIRAKLGWRMADEIERLRGLLREARSSGMLWTGIAQRIDAALSTNSSEISSGLVIADSADEVHERFCAVYLGVPGECNCKTGPR